MRGQLTCDPWEVPAPYELKRVLGNVGRPGITMLVPPKNPIMRPKDPSSWRVVSNSDFNGRAEDHFGKTSLHLSFTEYYVPLYQNAGHGQDNQIFFLESVVSVHDSGVWVGDVDILRALEGGQVQRMGILPCNHTDQVQFTTHMISAEGWDDVLDPPNENLVIRGNGNWVARLAATAILSQSLPRDDWSGITICPNSVCWSCNLPAGRNPNFAHSVTTIRGLSRAFVF
jgi:hypothetical protein